MTQVASVPSKAKLLEVVQDAIIEEPTKEIDSKYQSRIKRETGDTFARDLRRGNDETVAGSSRVDDKTSIDHEDKSIKTGTGQVAFVTQLNDEQRFSSVEQKEEPKAEKVESNYDDSQDGFEDYSEDEFENTIEA